MMEDADWTHWLAEPLRGRKVILGYRVVAGATRTVHDLEAWGSQRPLLISVGRGTGSVPDPGSYVSHRIRADPPETMTEEVRRVARWSTDPPRNVAEAVAAYDPEGEAVWWSTPFGTNDRCLGRDVLGGRAPSWSALEDKMVCDELWDAAGVHRAPSRIVSVDSDALDSAMHALDRGLGTVWAGDAREGLNGGNDYVRWVRTSDQAVRAVEFFEARCDRVRVMPYLEGTACSIHGFVLPDGVAAFRPVEMIQLPDPESSAIVYGGMSTWWDPAPKAREEMRHAARAVGGLLAERVGYRGGFSIDGVVTAEGFRPTELNPRFSGGLGALARSVPEVPIELVQLNAVLGRDVRMPAATLEARITRAADEMRGGRAVAILAGARRGQSSDYPVRWAGDDFALADGADADGVVSLGPSMISGSFGMLELDEPLIRRGDTGVPHARALRRFAAHTLGAA